MSAQEAAYHFLSIPMKKLTSMVVFVDTSPKIERITVMKNAKFLAQVEDDDTNVFCKNLVDRYQHRPQLLSSMCLAANYQVKYSGSEEDSNDVLPVEEEDMFACGTITLNDGFGTMVKRRKELLLDFIVIARIANQATTANAVLFMEERRQLLTWWL